MDIVIISNFCMDFSKTDNDRFFYIAKNLAQNNEVEIITSDFFHTKKCFRNKPASKCDFKITFLHETGYSKNVCLKRFYSHFIWGTEVYKYLRKRNKPDIVYCAVPSLTGPYLVSKYCVKENIPFVIDVQDLWPEAFQMVFNVPVISNLIFSPFKFLADGIYKRASEVIAVSQTYVNRALNVNKKRKKGHSVFLGTELTTFDTNAKTKKDFNKEENEIWLAYCGTLGSSYDLTCAIDAVALAKDMCDKKIKFVIMGDGPRQLEFEEYAKKKKIDCIFTGRLPYDQMCSLLSVCDINVNPITGGAAQSIINKHADYAASGHPVINTQENDEYCRLVESYNMGFNCKNNNANELAEKLSLLANNDLLRNEMGRNARKCAEDKFNRANSYNEIMNVILDQAKERI
jgi:glycosyltransferase involved in cell wall biosynthesis